MKTYCLFLLAIFLSTFSFAQNLFPVKLNNCNTSGFCLDCGDIKAGFDEEKFQTMLDEAANKLELRGKTGSVYFQVLVDNKGRGCVLSHNDPSNHIITKTLIKKMNRFKYWTPASKDSKLESNTSINVLISIKNGAFYGEVERVDMDRFKASLNRPKSPKIDNESYVYKNENLKQYTISCWNENNSDLLNQRNQKICIDSSGVLWYTMDNSMGITYDDTFSVFEQDIHEPGMIGFGHNALTIDNSNKIWISANKGIYNYDDNSWSYLDSMEIGTLSATEIVANKYNDNILLITRNGLIVKNEIQWLRLDQDTIPELPTNSIFYANYDSQQRLWIGTFKGTIMIDVDGSITSFNVSKSLLEGKAITCMSEDSHGNIYFALYEFNAKSHNKKAGLGILQNDGTWRQLTIDNSGLPSHRITDIEYDSFDDLLWISTYGAGLVRYDLKDDWQIYHSDNSEICTSVVFDIDIDRKNGDLYLGTESGIVKISR